MLKTRVKAGPITNLTDARYFAAQEVAWLSFCFDPGADTYIRPEQMLAIRGWVDSVEIIGEFGLQPASDILRLAAEAQLDAIQLGHFAQPEEAETFAPLPVFKEWVLQADANPLQTHTLLREAGADFQGIVLDYTRAGLSEQALSVVHPFGLSWLVSLCNVTPIYLLLDWTPTLLEQALVALPIAGIQLRGGVEEKVGYKSFDELDALFEALRMAE